MSAGASDNQELLQKANELLNLHPLDLKILLGFIVGSLFVVLLVQLVKKLMRTVFYFPNSRKATPFLQTPPSKETTGSQGMATEEQTAAIIERLVEVERMGKATEANSNRMEALDETLRKVDAANAELRTKVTQLKGDKSAMDVKLGKATEANSNRMEALEEELRKVDAANAELRTKVTQLQGDVKELEDCIRNKDAELQKILREVEQKQTEMQLNLTKVESANETVLESPVSPDNLIPLYQYYNSNSEGHFYTTTWSELEGGRIGYAYEGVACKLLNDGTAEGSVPLHRLCNLRNGDHFYTTTREELGVLEKEYRIEGLPGFAFQTPKTGTVPLYRYFERTSGDHLYTTNFGDDWRLAIEGYVFEKIACYVYPSSDM